MSMSDELRQRTTAVPSRRSVRVDRAVTAELRVVMPPALAATIPLSVDRVVLGRQAEQPGAPEIGDVSVSRKHFAIEWDAGGGFHTGLDLGSSNGSFIDSVRAVSRLPLADGTYHYRLTVKDKEGRTVIAANRAIEISTTGPEGKVPVIPVQGANQETPDQGNPK